MYIPERGDIIHLQFDPASGQEMKGNHFALVVSSKSFNQRGLAFVCPISQGVHSRSFGTVVSLMGTGLHTQGAVHCHQLKSLDWKIRQAKCKEQVPDFIVEDVLLRIEAILSD
ncbi:growth inhibitor PemK [Canicola haemoglobinophilus]|uniref:Pemk-like protein n=1 Tax=Canicola haemoglobinophilus TaxID=733 RepID=A0A1V4AYZ4_9PAST|nr:type II toxin-antitoxin system PemK/MazF family toxin [Canicola haemoglobinophilus]OOR98037.1 growth inhibitor PemK [Canicola haemoglobinophilus]STO53985.1 pemk-like protein [Canicola haemoglobinophilus]STO60578.1 pemk-like protein [Canicola haemoglobinophilus]STO68518.1 pemk-like protein [Canicola haemoglobinophilus]